MITPQTQPPLQAYPAALPAQLYGLAVCCHRAPRAAGLQGQGAHVEMPHQLVFMLVYIVQSLPFAMQACVLQCGSSPARGQHASAAECIPTGHADMVLQYAWGATCRSSRHAVQVQERVLQLATVVTAAEALPHSQCSQSASQLLVSCDIGILPACAQNSSRAHSWLFSSYVSHSRSIGWLVPGPTLAVMKSWPWRGPTQPTRRSIRERGGPASMPGQ